MEILGIENLVVGPLDTNCYILSDLRIKEAVIIDPGDDSDKITNFVNSTNLKIRHILLTHAHYDHVGAVQKVSEFYNIKPKMHVFEKADQVSGITVAMPETDDIEDGTNIKCGDISIETIWTPGHTAGSISFLTENNIFAGDFLFAGSIGRTDLPGGSPAQMRESLKKVFIDRKIDDKTKVWSGHGPSTTMGDERRINPFVITVLKEAGLQ